MTTDSRKGIISFTITDRGALHSSYMSFLQNGGLFVPTSRHYDLGDEVFMLLKFMNDDTYSTVKGAVVWMTPAGAQGNKAPGIGVHFSEEDNGKTRDIIEQHLASVSQIDRLTQTM